MADKKIFIPLTLDNSNRSFFKETSWILLAVYVLLDALSMIAVFVLYDEYRMLNFFGTPAWLVIGFFLSNWFWIFLIRKTVLKEKLLIRLYKQSKLHEVTDLGLFWGIYNIDGTKLMFVDGRIGTVIGVQRGYLFGRPPEFEQEHYKNLSLFLRQFLNAGYCIKYYNRSTNDANTGPLEDIEKNLQLMKGTGLYTISTAIIRFLREATSSIADTEYEYFLVTCTDLMQMNNLDVICEEAMSFLEDTTYINVHRLEPKEIYQFLQDYYGLKYLSVAKLIRDTFAQDARKLVAIKEIIYQDSLDLDTTDESLNTKLGIDLNKDKIDVDDEDLAAIHKLQEQQAAILEEQKEKVREIALARRNIDPRKIKKRKLNKILAEITDAEIQDIMREVYAISSGVATEALKRLEEQKPSYDHEALHEVDFGEEAESALLTREPEHEPTGWASVMSASTTFGLDSGRIDLHKSEESTKDGWSLDLSKSVINQDTDFSLQGSYGLEDGEEELDLDSSYFEMPGMKGWNPKPSSEPLDTKLMNDDNLYL